MISMKREPTHPGGILRRHYLEPLDLSVSEAARALGVSRKTLSSIVNEHGTVTADMALRLARTFKTTPELWINLQSSHDLWRASHQSRDWRQARIMIHGAAFASI